MSVEANSIRQKDIVDIFFSDTKRLSAMDPERESELGYIIKAAREAVAEEQKRFEDPEFLDVAEEVLKKIKGVCIDNEFTGNDDGINSVGKSDDAMNEEDGYKEEEDDEIKINGKNLFGLDDEEADLLALLKGERFVGEYDVLPDNELFEEFEIFKKGCDFAHEAEIELVLRNLRLIVTIASQYRKKGIPYLDLIQEGYKGAMEAARKFDPDFKCKFSTYAGWWIRQRIRSVIMNSGREIRYPQHVNEKLNKMKWAKNEIRHDGSHLNNQNPSIEEISEIIGVDVQVMKKMVNLPFAAKVLDAPLKGDESESDLHDIIADESVASPDQTIANLMQERYVLMLMQGLNPREREVIERRFGLNGRAESETLEGIAEKRVSRERIRQIESNALVKLRRKMAVLMKDHDLDRESLS